MKNSILFLLFFLFLVNGVLAISFSPTTLNYEMGVGEKVCQTVSLDSDSTEISILDRWAENSDIEWKISLFEKDSSYHSLNLEYGNLSEDGLLEVCLTGESSGEYHGVLLLAEEQQGSSAIQVGIWLKVIIEEEENPVSPPPIPSSSGSGPNTKKVVSGNVSATEIEEEESLDSLEQENVEESSDVFSEGGEKVNSITGSSIAGLGKGSILVSIFIVVIVIGFGIFMRKKR